MAGRPAPSTVATDSVTDDSAVRPADPTAKTRRMCHSSTASATRPVTPGVQVGLAALDNAPSYATRTGDAEKGTLDSPALPAVLTATVTVPETAIRAASCGSKGFGPAEAAATRPTGSPPTRTTAAVAAGGGSTAHPISAGCRAHRLRTAKSLSSSSITVAAVSAMATDTGIRRLPNPSEPSGTLPRPAPVPRPRTQQTGYAGPGAPPTVRASNDQP